MLWDLLTTYAGGGVSAPTAAMGWRAWWNPMDATKVFSDAGTTPTVVDAVDATGQAYQLNGSLGVVANSYFRQTTEANRPFYKSGGAGGKSYLLFDGSDDYMESLASSNFLAVGAKTIVVALSSEVDSNNLGAFGDTTSQYQAVNVYSGRVLKYYNYSGGDTYSTGQSYSSGVPLVYAIKHDTGKTYDAKNGVAWSTGVDSGDTGSLARLLAIGRNGSNYLTYRLYSAVIANVVVSDANLALVVNYFKAQLGI